MAELQAYTAAGSPGGTTSDAWEDAPTSAASGTSATLPDSTEVLVLAIGQTRNDGGTHQAELEARVGSTRIGVVAHRSTFTGGNGATGGAQLFAARRVTTGTGDSLNFRRRSSASGSATLVGSLLAIAWPLAGIPSGLRHHSESPNDDTLVTQPANVAGWVPLGTEGAGQLRFTPAESGDYLVLASCELFPLAGMPAFRALTARLAYREVSSGTWTFVDANDYLLRDPDPSVETSRHCQGFFERIPVTAGTEYVVAVLAQGSDANGLMGSGRICVHGFAPSAYEALDSATVGLTTVGGSATLDVAGAAVTASPTGTRNFVSLATFASSGAGIDFWTDHFLRSDEGTPGDTGDDDSGAAFGYGGDNFDADQNLRIMAMRFLGGVSSDVVVTPRITTLGGPGNSYDRITATTFALYSPDVTYVDVTPGEASAVVDASAEFATDQAITGEASVVVDATAAIGTSGTIEVSGSAVALVDATAALALDFTMGGEAVVVVVALADVRLDFSVRGESTVVVDASGTIEATQDGIVDLGGEVVVVVDASLGPSIDIGVRGEASALVDATATILATSTVDPAWLEAILSDSEPFTTRSS